MGLCCYTFVVQRLHDRRIAAYQEQGWRRRERYTLNILDRFLARTFQEYKGMSMVARSIEMPEIPQERETEDAEVDREQLDKWLARREAVEALVGEDLRTEPTGPDA